MINDSLHSTLSGIWKENHLENMKILKDFEAYIEVLASREKILAEFKLAIQRERFANFAGI